MLISGILPTRQDNVHEQVYIGVSELSKCESMAGETATFKETGMLVSDIL